MVGHDSHSDKLKNYDFAIAGAASGFITRGLSQPLDVLKIRFQLQVEPIKRSDYSKYQSIRQAIKTIYSEEGWTSLWKGHIPAQLLSMFYGFVQFYSFEMLSKQMSTINSNGSYKSLLNFACGSSAGILATVVSFPFDVVRTRLVAQSEANKVYIGITDAFKKILTQESFYVLFRGLTPSLLQVAPHAGVQFMSYKLIDSFYRSILDVDNKSYTFIGSIISGGFAGLCAKTFIYPLDLMRKRLQIQGFEEGRAYFGKIFTCKGLIDCVIKVYRDEGFFSLYKGLSPSLLKAVVSSALHFGSYELICNILTIYRS